MVKGRIATIFLKTLALQKIYPSAYISHVLQTIYLYQLVRSVSINEVFARHELPC